MLGTVTTTQARLLHDHKIERLDHCMDALGKDYADLDEGRRQRHWDKAPGEKKWSDLKGEMDEPRHKDAIEHCMGTHD